MALDGFVYYYGKYNLSPNILETYVDFNTYSTGVFPTTSGNPLYYLTEIGQTGADSVSGSGYLTSGLFQLNSGDTIGKDDLSALIIFEKETEGQQVLISTLSQSNDGISGFIFGVNDSNKLYLTTCNNVGGFEHHIFSTQIAKKNGVALTKDNNNFSLLKFNFFEKAIYEERATFSNDCLTNGSGFLLGGVTGSISGLLTPSFNGYFDEFVLFNQPLNSTYISGLFRGLCSAQPETGYGVINEYSTYSYNGLTSLRNPQFDSLTSGALDYIQSNIFNITGIGTVTVVSSGVVSSNIADVSGYLSGYVTLPTGYSVINSGQRVTGYSFSGQTPLTSGITGYTLVSLNPFAAYDNDKYLFSGYSGITGVTSWQDIFSGALYETYYTSGFVSSGVRTYYNFPIAFSISGMSGDAVYTHIAKYTNNGNDKILVQHDLTYSGSVGQSTPFRVLKNTYLDYGQTQTEVAPDFNFATGFSMDGVSLINPIGSGWKMSLDYRTDSGDYRFNKDLVLDYSSGMFRTENVEESGLMFPFFNGKFSPSLIETGSLTGASEYDYDNTYLVSELNYDRIDEAIIDYFSGSNVISYGPASLNSGDSIFLSGGFFFINGQKLISGVDYTGLNCITTQYSGIGGYKYLVIPSVSINSLTGNNTSLTGVFPENGTMLYLNGIRQKINKDYVETSKFDIIYNLTGNYEQEYDSVFDSDNFVI